MFDKVLEEVVPFNHYKKGCGLSILRFLDSRSLINTIKAKDFHFLVFILSRHFLNQIKDRFKINTAPFF
jgi:hypothetical protein